MKWKIGVYRTVYQSKEFTVNADTEEDAHRLARIEAGITVFPEGNVEYECETFEEPNDDNA